MFCNTKTTVSTIALSLALLVTLLIVTVPCVIAAEDSWMTMEPMPTARSGFGVAVVDGKIYAIGGYNGSYLAVNEMYDPATDTWTTKKSMPTPRHSFGIAVYQNKIYVIGGLIGPSDSETSGYTSVTEVYNPETDTWENKTSMPTARSDLSANVVDGKIFLIGGWRYTSVGTNYYDINVNEIYDPETDTWSTKTSIPEYACDYASAVIENKIYIIGGLKLARMWTYGATLSLDNNQIYDAETDTWSSGKNIPTIITARAAGATTGLLAPKRIYVFGGNVGINVASNLTQVYDPENDTWTTGTSMPTPRWSLGVAVVNDELYAIGGKTEEGDNFSAANEKYTPANYIPEFPSWTILPLLITTTLLILIYKKRLPKKHQNQKKSFILGD